MAETLIYDNLKLLGFNFEDIVERSLDRLNAKSMSRIFHFLLTKLDERRAIKEFKECWPISNSIQQEQYYQILSSWLSELNLMENIGGLHGESNKVNKSVLKSCHGQKFTDILFSLSSLVMRKVSKTSTIFVNSLKNVNGSSNFALKKKVLQLHLKLLCNKIHHGIEKQKKTKESCIALRDKLLTFQMSPPSKDDTNLTMLSADSKEGKFVKPTERQKQIGLNEEEVKKLQMINDLWKLDLSKLYVPTIDPKQTVSSEVISKIFLHDKVDIAGGILKNMDTLHNNITELQEMVPILLSALKEHNKGSDGKPDDEKDIERLKERVDSLKKEISENISEKREFRII